MKSKQQSITSLPPSPEADRHSRMLKYSIAMTIRFACVIALVFVRDWWMLIPALGAIFLPYFAVVIANATVSRRGTDPERPGAVIPYSRPEAEAGEAHEAPAPRSATDHGSPLENEDQPRDGKSA